MDYSARRTTARAAVITREVAEKIKKGDATSVSLFYFVRCRLSIVRCRIVIRFGIWDLGFGI